MSVDLENLKIVFQYLQQNRNELKAKENELARKMGIDPDNDIWVVPEKFLRIYPMQLPRWIKTSRYIETPYIAVGVQNPLVYVDDLINRSMIKERKNNE